MKLLHVALLSMSAAVCVTQSAQAADASKKRDPGAPKKVLGAPPGGMLQASKHGPTTVDCKSDEAVCGNIGIYAQYNETLQKCVVYIDVGNINVPSSALPLGGKIVVKWEIVSLDGGTYKFTDDGINIVSNDQTMDWDSKGGKTVYKWRSVHKRLWQSDYVINVVRKHPKTGAWDNCDPTDPRINNT